MKHLPPWVFTCEGRPRQGDTAGMRDLHVWRRTPRGAVCLKCKTTLTPEDTAECFGAQAQSSTGRNGDDTE
jgi:hypothetical protein